MFRYKPIFIALILSTIYSNLDAKRVFSSTEQHETMINIQPQISSQEVTSQNPSLSETKPKCACSWCQLSEEQKQEIRRKSLRRLLLIVGLELGVFAVAGAGAAIGTYIEDKRAAERERNKPKSAATP